MRKFLQHPLTKLLAFLMLLGIFMYGAEIKTAIITQIFPTRPFKQAKKKQMLEAAGVYFDNQTDDLVEQLAKDGNPQTIRKFLKEEKKLDVNTQAIQTGMFPGTENNNRPSTAESKLSTPPTWILERLTGPNQWTTVAPEEIADTDDTTGTWRITVPADRENIIPFRIGKRQELLKISLTGEIKIAPMTTWTTPAEGKYRVEQFPTKDLFTTKTALAGEAMMKFDVSEWEPIGSSMLQPYQMKDEISKLTFGDNCIKNEIGAGQGSYTFTFKIQ